MKTDKELTKEIERLEEMLKNELNGQTRLLLVARINTLIWVLN